MTWLILVAWALRGGRRLHVAFNAGEEGESEAPVSRRRFQPAGRRTSDDSSGDRPRSGTAWPDPGGAPNHGGVRLLGGLVLYASYLYASRPGANRLYESASGRHASIGRHGQATALAACRPHWPRSAKGCRQPGPEPELLRLQVRKQGLRSSSVLLMPSPLPRRRTGRRAPSVGHEVS
jgi:hypothetical protein